MKSHWLGRVIQSIKRAIAKRPPGSTFSHIDDIIWRYKDNPYKLHNPEVLYLLQVQLWISTNANSVQKQFRLFKRIRRKYPSTQMHLSSHARAYSSQLLCFSYRTLLVQQRSFVNVSSSYTRRLWAQRLLLNWTQWKAGPRLFLQEDYVGY